MKKCRKATALVGAVILFVLTVIPRLSASAAGSLLIPDISFYAASRGQITVTVTLPPVKALTGALIILEYDHSQFEVVSAKAAQGTDPDGEPYMLFSGLWSFGERTDGAYAAAFVSAGGVTKSAPAEFCSFVLRVLDGRKPCNVTASVMEFTTDDGNDYNDCYKRTVIGNKTYSFSDADRFSLKSDSEDSVIIDGYYFCEPCVTVPEVIGKNAVSGIASGSFASCQNAWISLPGVPLHIESGAFSPSEGTLLLCPSGSDASQYAVASELPVIVFDRDAVLYLNNSIIVSDKGPFNSLSEVLVSHGASYEILPSFSGKAPIFSTGSSIGISGRMLYLSVLGDPNGDGVTDALDLFLTQQAVLHKEFYPEVNTRAICFSGNTAPDVFDYSIMVNRSLTTRERWDIYEN